MTGLHEYRERHPSASPEEAQRVAEIMRSYEADLQQLEYVHHQRLVDLEKARSELLKRLEVEVMNALTNRLPDIQRRHAGLMGVTRKAADRAVTMLLVGAGISLVFAAFALVSLVSEFPQGSFLAKVVGALIGLGLGIAVVYRSWRESERSPRHRLWHLK